jgi:hypothetical protein
LKRPEKVRVLGKPYKVNWVPKVGDGLNGDADSDALEIKVVDGLKLETEQDVLLHEVLHSVEAQMGLDLEETVIERMATGLLAVIKDNPGFVSYLRRRK